MFPPPRCLKRKQVHRFAAETSHSTRRQQGLGAMIRKLMMALVLMPMMALATTWYVNGSAGSDSYSGKSASAAKATIQAAIDASAAGDTILVAPGTYAPIATGNKAITIRGTAGASSTIIDGQGSKVCVSAGKYNDDRGPVAVCTKTIITGFTLKNGNGKNSRTEPGNGGCASCGTYKNCIINDGESDGGGCGAWAIFENCLIKGGHAINGGNVVGSIVRNCTMADGYASDNGGAYYNCAVYNSVCYNNDSGWRWGSDNGTSYTTSSYYWGDSDPCKEVGCEQVNVYKGDPGFVDAVNGDYRLAAGSPCIDAGDNSYVTTTTDLAGNARIVNGKVDIGCYEYGAASSVNITGGLVAYWPFDGNANDASGNGNHGVVHGAILTADRFGNANGAYLFDGSSYIEVPHSDSIDNITDAVTISAWVNATGGYMGGGVTVDQEYISILCKGYEKRQYGIQIRNDNDWLFALPESESSSIITCGSTAGWTLSCWQHVALTYDGATIKTFVNGVQVGLASYTKKLAVNTQSLYIGMDVGCTGIFGEAWSQIEYLKGNMDDLRIYNRALSAAEVKALYDGTAVTPPTTYKVTFNANGGSVSPASRSVASGAAVGTLPTPTRSGYIFEGWWTAANGGAQVSASTKVTGNVTYYAHWAKGTFYTVTFDVRGGSLGGASKTRSVLSGSAVGELPTPTHASVVSSDNTWDYEFIGWYTEANHGVKVGSRTIVTSDVTYYACWEIICHGYVPISIDGIMGSKDYSGIYSYPIIIDAGGGNGYPRVIGKWSSGKYVLPQCPFARKGYVFAGWAMSDRCYWVGGDTYSWMCQSRDKVTVGSGYRGIYAAGAKVEMCGTTALVAQWRAGSAVRLTVKPSSTKYGTASGGGNYGAGATATLKAKAKKGYAFAGWFKDKSYKTALNPADYDNRNPTVKYVVPDADTTVYAKFISKPAAKKSLKFSSATKKLATTPKKVQTGKSLSLALGISSATLVKVTAKGLPKGLSINSKTGKITGTPTKPGTYTVTVTVTDAAGNKITQKVKITVALPSWAKGTFYGYTYSGSSFGRDSRKVTITISSSGKASAKIGDVSLPSKKLSYDTERGCYYFHCGRNGRKVGDRIYYDELSFEVKPNAAWNEDAITGNFFQSFCFSDGSGCLAGPSNKDQSVRARKNAAATNAKAKKVAAGCARIGTQTMAVLVNDYPKLKYDYVLYCPKCMDSDYFLGSEKVYVKTDKNGIATLSGSIAGTRVSGTTYIEYNTVTNRLGVVPFARFFSANFVIEISYYVSQYVTETDWDGNTTGRAWKQK